MARPVSTRAMFLLYSTEPRRSATGSVASAAAWEAAAMTSSASGVLRDRRLDLVDGAPEAPPLDEPRPGQHLLRGRGPYRRHAEVGQADPRLRDPPVVVKGELHGHPRDRVVADLAFQLEVGAAAVGTARTSGRTAAATRAPAGRRNTNLGQNLPRLQRGHEQPMKEVVHPDAALPLRPPRHHLGAQRDHRRRMIIRRIPVRHIPADRGPVPHERVGDDLGGVEEDRVACGHHRALLQRRLGHQRPNPQMAALLGDRVQPGHPPDVHDVRRRRQPQLEHRQQTLSARHDLGVVELAKQRERLLQAAGCVIVEGWGDHSFTSLAVSARQRPRGTPPKSGRRRTRAGRCALLLNLTLHYVYFTLHNVHYTLHISLR